MTKESIIEDILESATGLFALQGYGSTSIRQIAQRAGVGLGTVGLYFSTKENLFLDVIARVIREISEERLQRLDVARAEGLTVEKVLEAAITPIASRVVEGDPTERGKPYLIRWAMQGPPRVEQRARSLHNPVSAAFIDAIQEALPGLDRNDAISGYAMLISTAYSRYLLDQRYGSLAVSTPRSSEKKHMEGSVRRVIGIVADGLRARVPDDA